jgi:integrase
VSKSTKSRRARKADRPAKPYPEFPLTPHASGASAGYRSDHLTKRFIELLQKLGLHRERFGFYTLRHVFRTVADECRDTPAVDLIMGHADPSMGAHYRERIEDARLVAVADHVRAWLFAERKAADDVIEFYQT